MYKVTNIFSEIASFFQKSSKISAIGAISGVMKNVKLNLRALGFEKPRPNCLYPALYKEKPYYANTDYARDTWDAMTDGQYGDMPEGFDGDYDWLGY